jgi:N-acetylglucosamine kinase-like BadF-type ATPase
VIFLGIDGGGSKTRFLLEDQEKNELAQLETGPSNWISSGPSTARESISRGILSLPSPPDVVCGGFAGAGRPEGLDFYRTCISSLLPKAKVFIETDAHIAYIGAIGLTPGVLLLVGTGSIAIARKADGTFLRTGGWGPTFGDEGSGFWIGKEAIRVALRAHDTGERSGFVADVADGLGLSRITDAPTAWKDGAINVRSVAAIAAGVVSKYPAEPAKAILTEAAKHLRELVEAARHHAQLPESCIRSIVGSIGSSDVMQPLIGLPFSPPKSGPAQGAILWARDRITAS